MDGSHFFWQLQYKNNQSVYLNGKSTLNVLYHTTPHCTLGRSQDNNTVIKWPVLPGRVTRFGHGHLALVAVEEWSI